MEIYAPAEDSYLLQKQVKKRAFGRVLDLGTGSGIQALTALQNSRVNEVVAVDINKEAIQNLKGLQVKQNLRRLTLLHGDLFAKVQGKFDLIIFNPPYLPQDAGISDPALYGGKKGWELSARFFLGASSFLQPTGKILFLFSSLTNKRKIEELISNHLFEFQELEQQKLAFETLFVYQVTKSLLLCQLEARGLKQISYFAQGKRGLIYRAVLNHQKITKLVKPLFPSQKNRITVAVKIKKKESTALNRIQNEIKWLKILNKHHLGPQLLFFGQDYLIYLFVEGEFILNWLKRRRIVQPNESIVKRELKEIFFNLLDQCFLLDRLKVNKGEMHRPLKHILIDSRNQPILIDFERAKETEQPQNVTQLVEFICSLKNELSEFTFSIPELRKLAREYKKTYNEEYLIEIKKEISS